MSNFPFYSSQNGSSARLELTQEAEPQEENNGEIQEPDRNIATLPTPGRTASRRRKPRGRPPGRRRGSTTSSSRALTRPNRPCTRSRGRTETRVQSQTLERAMTLPDIAESISPEEREVQPTTPSQAPPYQLRRNRAPRYRCGTCGSRYCSCVNLIERKPPDDQLARGVDALTPILAEENTFEDHEQRTIWAIQTNNPDGPQVHHIHITVEKTYSTLKQV